MRFHEGVLMDLDHAIHWILNDGWTFSVLMVFMVASWVAVFFCARGNKKMLTKTRAGHDMDCFAQEMAAAGHNEDVARAVYRYIQEAHDIDFPILPGDDLSTTLGITDDDVYRAIPALLTGAGRAPQIGRLKQQIITVADLVDFVERAPLPANYVRELQTA
jgi:hypothetical protein